MPRQIFKSIRHKASREASPPFRNVLLISPFGSSLGQRPGTYVLVVQGRSAKPSFLRRRRSVLHCTSTLLILSCHRTWGCRERYWLPVSYVQRRLQPFRYYRLHFLFSPARPVAKPASLPPSLFVLAGFGMRELGGHPRQPRPLFISLVALNNGVHVWKYWQNASPE
jgi:hypothetical protein